jgi:cobalt-zinc-cadmium efflux system outer membrane protein
VRYLPGVLILAGLAASCAIKPPASPPVTEAGIQSRTGHVVRPPAERADGALPPGVDLADGVTQDEAVATALWSNAQLAADLAGLGLARADLVDAGQFRNPTLGMLFPIGPKPFELTLAFPIEQFWQRPKRIKAAQARWDLVAEGLIQNGLNTAHAARRQHAALVQAQERLAAAREGAAVRERIAGLARARLQAGDISELESRAAANEAEAAADLAARADHDLSIARDRLRVALGLAPGTAIAGIAAPPDRVEPAPVDRLREQAWSERSDLRAAEMAVAAAGARAKWERSRLVALGVVLSSKEVGDYGVRSGPGVSVDLPIFRSNAGAVSRADAEVEQAARQYLALRHRIDLEVSEARAGLAQAQGSLAAYHDRIVPAARDLAVRANRAFQAGDVSYLTVLEYTRQALDASLKDVDLQAAVRMAAADLDRSVGTRAVKGPQP